MNDEFYSKFPSFNKNSKENRRHQKFTVDYNEFLRTKKDVPIENRNKTLKSKIPVSKPQSIDVFSVEERNKKAKNESREKQILYQKLLLQQIEEEKIKRKIQKEKERDNERILEERLQKQIESMNIKNNDPWPSNRVVERISLSENDKYSSRRNNDVYRYFSKSSISLFNYKDKYFNDLNFGKHNQEVRQLANCSQCHKKVEILCNECQHHKQYNHLNEALNIDFPPNRTNRPLKMLTYRDNYAPYTFDNSTRLQKNTQNDLEKYNYPKIYKELKKMKNPNENVIKNDVIIDKKDELEELLGDQQYTVITGYAKSLLEKK
ncbi:mRNA export factor GLE1 [Chironomus tepperi]|uniref:mRNA export factor GLE1 n=1 Tax=Chironomus tepperi TaxID=113505 RepID=UPI00391F592A